LGRYAASEIGRQLKDARVARGLSRIQAAKVLEVKRQMIYNYEKGKSLPSLEVLIRAATAWGATFKLGGCRVLPGHDDRRAKKRPEPIQQVFPFRTPRHYKKASVKIQRRENEIVIIATIRNGV